MHNFLKIICLLVFLINLDAGYVTGQVTGDINGDYSVDMDDLQLLAVQWLDPPGCAGYPTDCADLVGSDGVNISDFSLVSQGWLQSDPLIISEIMANRESGFQTHIQPPVGGSELVSPDWIEIHNRSDESVSLNGWYLSDNKDNLTKWQFPASPTINIPAGGYLVVFASSKMEKHYPGNYPYVDLDGYYHTNFQLGRDGEFLALVKPDGVTIAHQYNKYPQQRGFISYGYCENTDEYGYFRTPTPEAANGSSCLTQVVGDTKFNYSRGFYDSSFYVTIVTDTPGATIRYTTDGSTPTTTHGTIYPGSPGINITTTTTLRALAYKTDYLETNVDTQTYIFLDDVINQPSNPSGYPTSGWGHAGPDYAMDSVVVTDPAYSGTIKNDLKSLPTLSLVMDVDDWFNPSTDVNIGGIYSNPDWEDLYNEEAERIVSVEFIDPCDVDEFHLTAHVRIAGGSSTSSWSSDKLSMRLKFREPDGPTKLNFQLFDNPDAADNFDTLVLESRYNTSWHYKKPSRVPAQNARAQYTRDQYVSDLHNAMGGYSQHGRHVHLYINGLYWGIYNIHERPDEAYASFYNQQDKEDYHALKPINEGPGYNIVNNGYNQSAQTSFNEMLAAADNAGNNPTDLNKWETVKQKLDIDNLIDLLLARWYVGDQDFCNDHQTLDDDSNWYATAYGNPAGPSKWRFHCWDAEKCMYDLYDAEFDKHPAALHDRLMPNIEYKMLFADHIHRHMFNDGVLTINKAKQLYQHRLDIVNRAVVAESARWGDNRIDLTPYIRFTRNDYWVPERDSLLIDYFPYRRDLVFNYLKTSMGLYPSVDAPEFSQHGGYVSAGYTLIITNPGSGTIWYTTNGEDPRLPGGSTNPNATSGSSVILNQSTRVQARVLNGGTWSALTDATFAVGPIAQNLRITELMYNPIDPCTEYIELQNISTVDSININYVSFTRGIDYTFPSILLDPCAYILVAKNPTAFAAQYPSVPSGIIKGPYQGKLANEGERIRLEDAASSVIHDFSYGDGWYDITDGLGFSLTVVDPVNTDPCDLSVKASWRPSAAIGGSPGWDDSSDLPDLGSVRINELLAHSHADACDWVELRNTTPQTINIGGWYLSDDSSNFKKYTIPVGMVLDPCYLPGSYLVFYEDQHFGIGNPADPCNVPFAFSQNGETAYLHSGQDGELTGYSEEESFDASQTGVAFGRYYKASTQTYNFVPMSTNTPGAPNASPKVGPIVISEIMYHPSGDPAAEYVELLNISGSTVNLWTYDPCTLSNVPWRFTDFGALEYDLPLYTSMTAGQRIILTRDSTAFNNEFTPAGGTVILAWLTGKLDNGGEKIELQLPGDYDVTEGKRYYIRVDRVSYSDGSHPDDFPNIGSDPWPTSPDGLGDTLDRKVDSDYGNDPANWQPASPSPGS